MICYNINLISLTKCSNLYRVIFYVLGLTLSYKGLLLLFGLFVSYETRSVKLRQINDSRYVGMSIYNVVVTCLITAPVIMVTASQQDASFAFVALSVIFCCFLSMALIFVPKVRNNDDFILTDNHE
jgi:gamma-aminobutyric acid type B receptor